MFRAIVNTLFALTMFLTMFGFLAGCAPSELTREQAIRKFQATNVLPPKTRTILDNAEKLELLSLDPKGECDALRRESDATDDSFHGYPVLGRVEIRDADERKKLLGALYKGIADCEMGPATCFVPRHGIHATLASETVDLVICFECFVVVTIAEHGKDVAITESPRETFNRLLQIAGLPTGK